MTTTQRSFMFRCNKKGKHKLTHKLTITPFSKVGRQRQNYRKAIVAKFGIKIPIRRKRSRLCLAFLKVCFCVPIIRLNSLVTTFPFRKGMQLCSLTSQILMLALGNIVQLKQKELGFCRIQEFRKTKYKIAVPMHQIVNTVWLTDNHQP